LSDTRKGLIFNVQKFSLHDGPGIRTIVFLKGCPLACKWCSNPEGRSREIELMHSSERCIGVEECGRMCSSACLEGALHADDDGRIRVDRSRCNACGECSHLCPSGALEMSGRWMSVSEVLRAVEEDDAFYARSGGGLTVSGGEPLAQGAFVRALLMAARRRGVDTAIETSGLCSWNTMSRVAPHTDRIFFDIKCLDDVKHRIGTGVSNASILENFKKLRHRFPATPVTVRTPIIPGFNDSVADIGAIVRFIAEAGGASSYELLPYHRFGEPKYAKLGRRYLLSEVESLAEGHLRELRSVAMQLN
jgi:pyruvate formate lyase activating enzyme